MRCVGVTPLTGPRTHRVTVTSSNNMNQHPNPVVTQTRLACLLIRGIEANMDTKKHTHITRPNPEVHRAPMMGFHLLETTCDAIMAQHHPSHRIARSCKNFIVRTNDRSLREGKTFESAQRSNHHSSEASRAARRGHASSAGVGALRVPRVGTCHGVMRYLDGRRRL